MFVREHNSKNTWNFAFQYSYWPKDNDGQNGQHICCRDCSVVSVVFWPLRNLDTPNCFGTIRESPQSQSLPFVRDNPAESAKLWCKEEDSKRKECCRSRSALDNRLFCSKHRTSKSIVHKRPTPWVRSIKQEWNCFSCAFYTCFGSSESHLVESTSHSISSVSQLQVSRCIMHLHRWWLDSLLVSCSSSLMRFYLHLWSAVILSLWYSCVGYMFSQKDAEA